MPPPELLHELYGEILYGKVLSVEWLRNKVEDAWFTLELYEVTLNADAEMARTLTRDSFPDSFPYNDEEMEEMKAEGLDEDDIFLDVALTTVEVDVVSKLQDNPCFPEIRITGDDFPANPSQLTQYWRFQNLIGAMYLQMMWVMTSGAQLARCEFCNLPISTRSHTGRASRPDKRFCNDSCRQAYHRKRRRGDD